MTQYSSLIGQQPRHIRHQEPGAARCLESIASMGPASISQDHRDNVIQTDEVSTTSQDTRLKKESLLKMDKLNAAENGYIKIYPISIYPFV